MKEQKTKQTESSVSAFIDTIEDETKRKDCHTLVDIFKKATGEEPKMWGTSIIGFGSYHYKYASGHEGDTCLVGFSPRKGNFAMYLSQDIVQNGSLTKDLGKFKTGKGCLYINKLEDINIPVFLELVKKSNEIAIERHGAQK